MRLFLTVVSALWLAVFAIGQAPPAADIPVVTVCEVLKDLPSYRDKSIIVVGLIWGTDEGGWLRADCERRLVTDGYTWSDSMSLTYVVGKTAPPPKLPAQFRWDRKLVAVKLRDVRRTTIRRPGNHERWAAIFGRLEANVPPQTGRDPKGNLRGYGFGHLGESPAQLISEFGHAYKVLH